MPPVHRHRASTSLRQSNKKHKSNTASKRSVHRNAGGKVGSNKASGPGEVITHAKAARALMSKQKREQSKMKFLERKRLQGRANFSVKDCADDLLVPASTTSLWWSRPNALVVPRVVGLISLSHVEDTLENNVRAFLIDAADDCVQDGIGCTNTVPTFACEASSFTAQYKKMKRDGHVTFLSNSSAFRSHYYNNNSNYKMSSEEVERRKKEDASVLAALDLCRVCDLVVFLVHHDVEDFNSYARHGLTNMNEDSFDMDDEDDDNDMNSAVMGTETGQNDAMKLGNSYKSCHSTHTMKHSQDFDYLISRRGDRILAAIKAQGLPTPLTVLVNEGNHSLNATNIDDSMSIFSMKSTKSLKRSGIKRKQDVKKYMSRFVTTEFGENAGKLMELDLPHIPFSSSLSQRDAFIDQKNLGSLKINHHSQSVSFTRDSLIRALCTMRCSTPKWVMDMPRAYILSNGSSSEHLESASTTMESVPVAHGYDSKHLGGGGFKYDIDSHELKITGYIRGQAPWNINSLIHIPSMGTFGVKSIENNDANASVASGTHSRRKRNNTDVPMGGDETTGAAPRRLCTLGDPLKRESLNMFACPDALEGEQNLVGFDNDDEPGNMDQFQPGAARPAGWSDYQASWLDALDASEDQEEEKIDHGELAFDLNKRDVGSHPAIDDEFSVHEYDIAPRENEKASLMNQRRSDHKTDSDFPDEMEIQRDEKARDRFARYRSIKSFRKTFWDPKENLPETYATIYHFSSFKNTENDVMVDMKNVVKRASETYSRKKGAITQKDISEDDRMTDENSSGDDGALEDMIPSGSFVTITVEGVLPFQYSRISGSGLIAAVSLLPHENKISVLQMGLNQSSQCDSDSTESIPIKSKDSLIFRCGWRTWQGRPIFSQNNLNSDKHKYERFMPTNGSFFASSVFGPVSYTPCPVLVFRKHPLEEKIDFVSHGSILDANADRIVVKRIVLTGYPTRVHKRHAVVKYMFYNPDDVKWFKPAGLITKHGLEGQILESVGEHGTMKCLFNAPIKQHDTVCLPLYKRIFPKYAPCEEINPNGESVSRHDILVL